jgi:hypothetical protein
VKVPAVLRVLLMVPAAVVLVAHKELDLVDHMVLVEVVQKMILQLLVVMEQMAQYELFGDSEDSSHQLTRQMYNDSK